MKIILVLVIVAACLFMCLLQSAHKKNIPAKQAEQIKSVNETDDNIYFLRFAMCRPMPP